MLPNLNNFHSLEVVDRVSETQLLLTHILLDSILKYLTLSVRTVTDMFAVDSIRTTSTCYGVRYMSIRQYCMLVLNHDGIFILLGYMCFYAERSIYRHDLTLDHAQKTTAQS